ncbi:F-box/kelch-repeat protein SKIP20-like [Tasmannia lanceolata]|uniref:F-box/kelch-repeat protein SKIP20-like n=1 Tax=Tasmannia lanceolata TaxID=3420 RepID=UPI004064759C
MKVLVEEQQFQNLIPGLPDEIALDCLIRVPYRFHSHMKSVCHRWNHLLSHPCFYNQRKIANKGEDFVCLVQALVAAPEPSDDEPKRTHLYNKTPSAVYGLTIYNTSNDTWQRMAHTPLLPTGIPMFSHCVSVPGKLVLVGGWEPATLDSVADVYVYDFIRAGGWRRGAPMSTPRSFFACAAVGSTVYVAGGHDNQKNALRSAEIYDPDSNTWQAIAPMAEGRDECQGITCGEGRFWVLSGYDTESQGRFDSAAECYDPVSREWTKIDGVWPFPNASPRGSCFLPEKWKSKIPKQDSRFLKFPTGPGKMTELPFPAMWFIDTNQRGVREYDRRDNSWKVVVGMKEGICSSPCVALINGGSSSDRVFVIGSGSATNGADGRHLACVLETCGRKWADVDIPPEFTGFVYSASSLHL